MKPARQAVVLCADDFALSPGVSQAIITLLEGERLSATSCMTLTTGWPHLAPLLRSLTHRVDLGLHLTLTALNPLGAMPHLAPQGHLPKLSTLMRLAFTGRLDAEEIGAELRRQLGAFVTALGREPDFIDGHQHVHVLPTIREQTLALLSQPPLAAAKTYLRVPWEHPLRILRRGTCIGRSLLITGLASPLRRAARRLAIPINDGFGGVRDFDPAVDFRHFFRKTLQVAAPASIIMCHPGYVDEELRAADPVTKSREQEFAYLASDAFLQDLAAANCRLSRFSELRNTFAVR